MHIRTVLNFLLIIGCLTFLSCGKKAVPGDTKSSEGLHNTNFKMGFSRSTGPLLNTFFFFQLNDTVLPLILTAHHVVAGTGSSDVYYKWDDLADKLPNAWLWSITDSTYQFGLGKNLPIPDARTLHLDLAAYYLGETLQDVATLKPAARPAIVGDTVYLFSKLKDGTDYRNINPAIVIYAVDSMIVYELQSNNLIRMDGTSGSPVLNVTNEVVSNSYGGFTIPDSSEINNIATLFPLVKKLPVRVGRAYGIGVPVNLIKTSLNRAFKRAVAQSKL